MFGLAGKTGASGPPGPLAHYVYISDQDTDKVTRYKYVDGVLSNRTEIVVTAITSGVSSLFHDGANLWICGKPDIAVTRLNGFTNSAAATYSFSGNTDVNASTAFVGLYVDTANQQMYVMNFVNGKVIKANTGYATTTQTAVTLSGTSTAMTIHEGDMYVANFSARVVTRYNGFSNSAVSSVNLTATTGNLYGLAFDTFGNMWVLFQVNSGTSKVVVYNGFSSTILHTFNEESSWGTSPQGLAVSLA